MAGRDKTKRRILSGILALVVIAVAVWLILVNYVFVIRDVEVYGNDAIEVQDVIRLSRVKMGARLDSVNEAYLKSCVESDGRLALESITRKYPNRLILNVRERTQDAMVLQAGKILVLDSDGYVLSINDRVPNLSVPYVTSLKVANYAVGKRVEADAVRIAGMKSVLEAIRAQGAVAYVSELSVEDPENMRIMSRTGMYVLLGDAQDMNNKIVWMAGALADLESRGQVSGKLDVSSGTKADYSAG